MELLDGRYELGAPLGSGGTGSVRRARDQVLGREVAVKLLHPGALDDAVHRARLRDEARLAGALHHPGIAQVFDYGEDPATSPPTPYVVMQLVEGPSLATVLREERTLPVARVLDLVGQVAAALAVAHGAGTVHRDLKPGNVVLAGDRAVLVDFGIARSTGGEPLTATGELVGTVDYLSPEQVAGGSAGPASDLYALGLLAYECLTGHKPFRRESPVATALAHLHDDAPPLPDEVPEGLRHLVARLVSRDPADRPASAADVAVAVGALTAATSAHESGATVLLTRPADPRVDGAGSARSRRRVLVALAAALVLAAGLLVATVVGRDGTPTVPAAGASDRATAPAAVERVRVPAGLVGTAYDEAARRVRERGLRPRRVERTTADAVAGTVVAVEPAARRRVDVGSVVRLVVAVTPPTPAPVAPSGGGAGGSSGDGGKAGGGAGRPGGGAKGKGGPPGGSKGRGKGGRGGGQGRGR
ncbi:serine/threonine-protein kinase [Nocardioides perillae]|nr:serine/threonine protein kinase [Nocardioides perillae]